MSAMSEFATDAAIAISLIDSISFAEAMCLLLNGTIGYREANRYIVECFDN